MYLLESPLREHQGHCGIPSPAGAGMGTARLARAARQLLTIAAEAEQGHELILALLVVATAHQGLGFNRAFFLALDQRGEALRGELAVGPASMEEAEAVWGHIRRTSPDLPTIYRRVKARFPHHDQALNRWVRGLSFPLARSSNPLVVSLRRREAFCVGRSRGCLFDWQGHGLHRTFSASGFVVAPVTYGREAMGVVVADNAITHSPISMGHADGLSLLADLTGAQVARLREAERLRRRISQLEGERERLSSSHERVIETERRQAVGQLVEQLSHHLRNPLSILGGAARRLHGRPEMEGARPYLEAILEQTQRMEESLNTLFSFSDPPELHRTRVQVSVVVKRAIAALEPKMRARGVSWHLSIRGQERSVAGDDVRLEEALIHVLQNGMEAMPHGGLLLITLECGEEEVAVQVADTGAGMAEGLLRRAAEPFFSTKNRGLGLGLSIARQVVEAHGGRLSLRHNRLGGMTVELALPTQGAPSCGGEEAPCS